MIIVCLAVFSTFILAANIYIYKLTVRQNHETLCQLWAWEDYMREWAREEIKICLRPRD